MGYFLWSGTGAIEELNCDSEAQALLELQVTHGDSTLWYRGEGFCRARLVAVKSLVAPIILREIPPTTPAARDTGKVMQAFRAAECRAPNPGEVMGQIIHEQHPAPLRPLTNWPEGFDLGGDRQLPPLE